MSKEMAKDCIHCGQCTKNCLFLQKYGIDLQELSERKELAYHCFLCGKCKEVCPQKIDGRAIALKNREQVVVSRNGKLPDNSYDGLLLEKNPYKFSNYRYGKKRSVFFTGCNFPSFYPETTRRLVEEFANHGVGVIYDCCGKPIEELGLKDEAEKIINSINMKLRDGGVEQLVMACPNCYYFLKDRLEVEVVSVYAKMKELGIGTPLANERVPIYYPCPDRNEKRIAKEMKEFILGEVVEPFSHIQCCGLGGCAAGKEADVAQKMTNLVKESSEGELYTYCASCICSFRRRGYEKAYHILPLLMGIDEKVPLGKTPILNRAKCKFL